MWAFLRKKLNERKSIMNFNAKKIEEKIGYAFNNKALLQQAFTRRSYAMENFGSLDNEVMEFIGDSIIGTVIVKHITQQYAYQIPIPVIEGDTIVDIKYLAGWELNEAEFSELKIDLVKRESLAAATERLGLEKYLLMGKSDIAGNVQERDSVKEDLLEAVVGAVAMDCGWNMAVLEPLVLSLIEVDTVLEEGRVGEYDYEKILKIWFNKSDMELVYEEEEPLNDRLKYACSVNLGMDMLFHVAYGYGLTEAGARRMAAKRAFKFIERITDRAEAVEKAVGLPEKDKAINQLQELYQKGIIPEPKYTYSEGGRSKSGNPMWTCECSIEGIKEANGGYICESKTESKKMAAFEAMCYLMGRDLAQIMINKGKQVSENKKEDN